MTGRTLTRRRDEGARRHLLGGRGVGGRAAVVVVGAGAQSAFRGQRQRVHPVAVPLQRPHQLAPLPPQRPAPLVRAPPPGHSRVQLTYWEDCI